MYAAKLNCFIDFSLETDFLYLSVDIHEFLLKTEVLNHFYSKARGQAKRFQLLIMKR